MKYEILNEEIVFEDFFKIKKARIKHDLFNSNTVEVERLSFERGDSVAIVLYEKDSDSLLFVKQFRYPTVKATNGWILELPAGSLEAEDTGLERVKKEMEEEIGYTLNEVEFISSFFVSPGGSSERILLYFSVVDSKNKTFTGGGNKFEKEDIQLVKFKTNEVIHKLKTKQFIDAKTILGLQWFLIHKTIDGSFLDYPKGSKT